jgi:predicted O-methyltransferase YrrM
MSDFVYAQVETGALSHAEAYCIYETALIAPKGVFLELGCQEGKSTITLAKADDARQVYTIDSGSGQFGRGFDTAKENFAKYGVSNVQTISSKTMDYVRYWRHPIALLFIDAGHLYGEVKEDFESYFPFVVPNGYVLFHDTTATGFPGIIKFINGEVALRLDIKFIKRITTTGMGLDVWKKTS